MINNQNEIKIGYFEKYFKKGIIVSKNNYINNFRIIKQELDIFRIIMGKHIKDI